MKTKKGFFFIMDLIIGLVLLVGGIIFILGFSAYAQNPYQLDVYATDFLSQLSYTTVEQMTADGNIQRAIADGHIDLLSEDKDKSLLQIIIELNQSDVPAQNDHARNITRSAATDAIGAGVEYVFLIDGAEFFSSGADFEDARQQIVKRKIFVGKENATTLLGPYVVEVRVWY
ncbi:MAG: hypothetical protein ACMXYF_05440 [Candidatus Woesearchaeota archaeon]